MLWWPQCFSPSLHPNKDMLLFSAYKSNLRYTHQDIVEQNMPVQMIRYYVHQLFEKNIIFISKQALFVLYILFSLGTMLSNQQFLKLFKEKSSA